MRQCGSDVIYYQNKHKVSRKYGKVKCGVLDFSGIFFNFYKKISTGVDASGKRRTARLLRADNNA